MSSERIEELESEVSDLEAQVEELQAEVADLEDELSHRNDEIEALQERIEAFEAKLCAFGDIPLGGFFIFEGERWQRARTAGHTAFLWGQITPRSFEMQTQVWRCDPPTWAKG